MPITNLYQSKAWQHTRERIALRDLYTCQMCSALLKSGRSNKEQTLTRPMVIDHLIPWQPYIGIIEGLQLSEWNLWAICCDCHDSTCQHIEKKPRPISITSAKAIRQEKLTHKAIGLDGYATHPKQRPIDSIKAIYK